MLRPPPTPPLAAGATEEVALDFVIPEAFAAGHHSVAVEVVSDRPGVAPAIAAVTVTVGTIDDVAMAVVPSTIRAHRRASFRLDIDNRSNRVVELELDGEGPDLDVRLRPDRVVLRPGERVRTSGRVKAPRHISRRAVAAHAHGDGAQLVGTELRPGHVPAAPHPAQGPALARRRSCSSSASGPARWVPGSCGGRRARGTRSPRRRRLVDTDGDGTLDTPGDQLVDTDGDGVPDTLAAVVAEEVAAAGEQGPPQAGGGDRPDADGDGRDGEGRPTEAIPAGSR